MTIFLTSPCLVAFAQTYSTRLPTSATLGGTSVQNTATVGRTLIMIVNYAGHVGMPILAALFVALGAFAYFTRRHFARCFIIAGLCVSVTAITRLFETLVRTAGR